jgi:hypothetical protein
MCEIMGPRTNRPLNPARQRLTIAAKHKVLLADSSQKMLLVSAMQL